VRPEVEEQPAFTKRLPDHLLAEKHGELSFVLTPKRSHTVDSWMTLIETNQGFRASFLEQGVINASIFW
jgi:hypothetical protein